MITWQRNTASADTSNTSLSSAKNYKPPLQKKEDSLRVHDAYETIYSSRTDKSDHDANNVHAKTSIVAEGCQLFFFK